MIEIEQALIILYCTDSNHIVLNDLERKKINIIPNRRFQIAQLTLNSRKPSTSGFVFLSLPLKMFHGKIQMAKSSQLNKINIKLWAIFYQFYRFLRYPDADSVRIVNSLPGGSW